MVSNETPVKDRSFIELDVSPSRISEYMTGRAEPTLRVARLLHKKLDIDADFLPG